MSTELLRHLVLEMKTSETIQAFSLFLLTATHIADVAMTTAILRRGGRELNALMAYLIANFKSAWGVVKFVAAVAAGIAMVLTGNALWVWLFIAIMLGVLAFNAKSLR